MEIPFHGQIDIGVLRRMNLTALAPSRRFKIVGAILVVVFLWGLVGVPLSYGQPVSDVLPAIGIVVVLAASFGYAAFFGGPRKLLKSSKLLNDPISGTITEEGVRTETPHSLTNMPWEVFYKAKIGKDVVLLYQSMQVLNVFPREFFASEEDWQAFLGLVRQRVSLKQPERRTGVRSVLIWVVILVIVVLVWVIRQAGDYGRDRGLARGRYELAG